MPQPTFLTRVLKTARVDFTPTHRQLSPIRILLATVLSIGGSLLADALLVAIGTAVFPAMKGYVHFRFSDYSKLTIIGVVIACVAWPIVTRISSSPRWLFFRLAILVTIGLYLPDLWLLTRHQPPKAVAVLMAMHLAIGLVTYNLLVRVAPIRRTDHGGQEAPVARSEPDGTSRSRRLVARREAASGGPSWVWNLSAWVAMACAVGLEFAVGVAALVLVPVGRSNQLIPRPGRTVYLVHAGWGGVLVVGAVMLLVASWRSNRLLRLSALTGVIGILLGAGGGVLAVHHSTRLGGIVLMFLGSIIAIFGYLVPVGESLPSHPRLGEPYQTRNQQEK